MICRGPAREFISWLKRNGKPPRIPHGALVRGIENCQLKGNELRVTPDGRSFGVVLEQAYAPLNGQLGVFKIFK